MATGYEIEAVALRIAENIIPQLRFGDADTLQLARNVNDGDGWTIEQSAPLGGVLRTEGLRLSERDLQAAHDLAWQMAGK